MIPFYQPYIPSLQDYTTFLQGIWYRDILTNNGPLVQRLEAELAERASDTQVVYTCNGTTALQIAIRLLGLKGEVITTPFSFIATSSSIVWEGCTPIYVDVDPETWNIDPNLIEAAITSKTTAIVATHLFGNACNIDMIQQVANRHGLKVIYDAAHAFGSTYRGDSIYSYGDISVASFHATKIFHTIEGGAIYVKDKALYEQAKMMRNFGHTCPESFACLGINGKNSEFHAAMGLSNLSMIDAIAETYHHIHDRYIEAFEDNPYFTFQGIQPDSEYNCAYFPILFQEEQMLNKLMKLLDDRQIGYKRYFRPSLNTLEFLNPTVAKNAQHLSNASVCLPCYYTLTDSEIDEIIRVVRLL